MSGPASWPVAGFVAPWPETKINRSNPTPGEYGPRGFGRPGAWIARADDDVLIAADGTIGVMPAQASFDVTSGVDLQEVDNAVNQARKELAQRYDFKGSKASIDFKRAENLLELIADDAFKMEAVWDILQTRLVRRGVSIKNLKPSDVEPIAGGLVKRTITLKQGIDGDAARAIMKFLKDQKLKKVQATIQADQIRMTSSSRDDLQIAIRLLKSQDFGVELQFGNYRE
jgi:uncharacterized protein YajQ (UPF0234 family)